MEGLDFSVIQMRLTRLAMDHSDIADEIQQIIDIVKTEQKKADSIKAVLSEVVTKL